jgi:hypothetical protein
VRDGVRVRSPRVRRRRPLPPRRGPLQGNGDTRARAARPLQAPRPSAMGDALRCARPALLPNAAGAGATRTQGPLARRAQLPPGGTVPSMQAPSIREDLLHPRLRNRYCIGVRATTRQGAAFQRTRAARHAARVVVAARQQGPTAIARGRRDYMARRVQPGGSVRARPRAWQGKWQEAGAPTYARPSIARPRQAAPAQPRRITRGAARRWRRPQQGAPRGATAFIAAIARRLANSPPRATSGAQRRRHR